MEPATKSSMFAGLLALTTLWGCAGSSTPSVSSLADYGDHHHGDGYGDGGYGGGGYGGGGCGNWNQYNVPNNQFTNNNYQVFITSNTPPSYTNNTPFQTGSLNFNNFLPTTSTPIANETSVNLDQSLLSRATVLSSGALDVQMGSNFAQAMSLCSGAVTACLAGQGQYIAPTSSFNQNGLQIFDFNPVGISPGTELTALEGQNGQLVGFRVFQFNSNGASGVTVTPDDRI